MLKHFIPILSFISGIGFAQNSNLTVTVSDIKNNSGTVIAELYNSKGSYLKRAFKIASSEIKSNSATLTFTGIPKGEYTVKVYHDENKNGKLDKYIIGIPKEPVACSNNAKGFMGPPKYDDAKFTFSSDLKMNIKMNPAH